MDLEQIADVELPSKGVYKFVLVEVRKGEETKKVLVGSPDYGYHAEILSDYRSRLEDGVRVERVLGGGRVEVGRAEIRTYGYSQSYGTAPQEEVERLLKRHISDKSDVSLKVKMGSGY
jgi:hypothetical protein